MRPVAVIIIRTFGGYKAFSIEYLRPGIEKTGASPVASKILVHMYAAIDNRHTDVVPCLAVCGRRSCERLNSARHVIVSRQPRTRALQRVVYRNVGYCWV